jgi:nitroreductase
MMNIEELRALIEGRRSTRRYDESQHVSDEIVRTILDCARWAPSGGNGQPWEFIVVREQAVRHHIADYYMKQMEQKREMDLAVLGDPRVKEAYPIRTKLEKAESHFITGLANATLLIHLAATSGLGVAVCQ